MRVLIKDGWLIDPSQGMEGKGHILIDGERISNTCFGRNFEVFCKELGLCENTELQENIGLQKNSITKSIGGLKVIDAKGKWVIPGLIDMHVHLRDPGLTYKEDIDSGCRGAAKGGVTTVCCMPNTKPVVDNRKTVEYILKAAANACGVRVMPVGAITAGLEGRVLSDIAEMIKPDTPYCSRGICAISDDGKTVMDEELMQSAMKEAAAIDIPVFSHTEDYNLSGGVMHQCDLSRRLGLKGIPAECEENIVARDIALADVTRCRLHICHVSTAGSIALIRNARKKGVSVTAEATPHHLTLIADDLTDKQGKPDTNKKMSPPLRAAEDVRAVRQALREGVISIIATDHAPHQEFEKNVPFEKAPFGSIGLETSFAVSYTELVRTGILTPMQLIDRMSTGPAGILGIEAGTLQQGAYADIAIVDVDEKWTISREQMLSKSKNTPFDGKEVFGSVLVTIAGGRIVYENATRN